MKFNAALGLGAVLAVMGGTTLASAQETTTTTVQDTTTTTAPNTTTTTAAPITTPSDTDMTQQQTVTTTSRTQMPYGSDVPVSRTTYPNRPLLVGSGMLGLAAYVPSAVAGGISDRSEDRYLFIPVAGPWIDLAQRDCNARPCGDEDLNKALIIGSGVVQGISALGVLSSFFVPESSRTLSTAQQKKFFVAPGQVSRSAYGMTAVGIF